MEIKWKGKAKEKDKEKGQERKGRKGVHKHHITRV